MILLQNKKPNPRFSSDRYVDTGYHLISSKNQECYLTDRHGKIGEVTLIPLPDLVLSGG